MQFARDFCIGQWMSDLYAELDKASKLEDEEEANDAKLQEEAQSKKKFLRSLLKVKPSEATKYVHTYIHAYILMGLLCFLSILFHSMLASVFKILDYTYIHLHV